MNCNMYNIRFFSLQKLREEEIVLNKILFLYMYSYPDSPLGRSHLFILSVSDHILAHNFLYWIILHLTVRARQVNQQESRQTTNDSVSTLLYRPPRVASLKVLF